MNKNEIHQVWAPPESPWSRWVKPVLFAFMDSRFQPPPASLKTFKTDWVPSSETSAIVIDLPGDDGVLWGVQLARLGYRPVPLYNALPFPPSHKQTPFSRPETTVDVEQILGALYRETSALKELNLSAEAPPAFLLDADRRIARNDPAPGRFDNRSVCFTTDFPSAGFLQSRNIRRAIVLQRGTEVAGDLLMLLLEWQKSGIQLLRKDPVESVPPVAFIVTRPSFLRYLWYRISVVLGLRRGELGGFGGIVPSGSG